ncbi:hypothetical protein Tco_0247185 [Tanacetum coccineum]
MKILELLEQRISKVGKHLKKAKEKMDINKGKEKMVMERDVIIIELDISYDHKPFQATSDESSNHNSFQATSDESSDHNSFKLPLMIPLSQALRILVALILLGKKPSKGILQWYDDLTSNEQMTVYKGRPRSRSKNAAICATLVVPTKRSKHLVPKSRSKRLAPTTPRTWSTCTTVIFLIKRPPLVTNYALGLAAVKTWQQILNKEFGIKKAKENVGGSSDVRRKGKRKMLQEL